MIGVVAKPPPRNADVAEPELLADILELEGEAANASSPCRCAAARVGTQATPTHLRPLRSLAVRALAG
jgi:hypothetical protein